MNALIDTTVWSLALRRRPQDLKPAEQFIVTELKELIRESRARLIGPVRQELLSGVKTAEQYERLRMALRAYPDEPIATSDYEAAASASNLCRSNGVAFSPTDVLICALAVAREWSVFSLDPDFQHYARILPIRLHSPR